MSVSDWGGPGHRSAAERMVAWRLALWTPLPTTKSEAGMRKQSEPETVDPSMVMNRSVACCITDVPPEFWVGLKTKSLRLTLSSTNVELFGSGFQKAFASAKSLDVWPGPRKPAANAALLVIAQTISAPITVTVNLCARVIWGCLHV